VISGYSGGKAVNPTYRNYSQGGHIEVVKVIFAPAKVSHDQLPDVFWPAGDYHQDYYLKNPVRYWYYRSRASDNKTPIDTGMTPSTFYIG